MYFEIKAMHYGRRLHPGPAVIEPESDEEQGALRCPPPFVGIYPLHVQSYIKTSVVNERPMALPPPTHLEIDLKKPGATPLRNIVHPICLKPKLVKSLPFKKRQITKATTTAKQYVRATLPPLKSSSTLPMGRPLGAPPSLPRMGTGGAILRKIAATTN